MIVFKLDFGSFSLSLSFSAAPFRILYSPTGSYPSLFCRSCSHLTLFPLHKHAEFYNVLFFLSLYTNPAQKYNSKDLFITLLQIVILTA